MNKKVFLHSSVFFLVIEFILVVMFICFYQHSLGDNQAAILRYFVIPTMQVLMFPIRIIENNLGIDLGEILWVFWFLPNGILWGIIVERLYFLGIAIKKHHANRL